MNSAVSRADGISEQELDALPKHRESKLFSDKERAALDFAESITTGNTVPDPLIESLRRYFSDDEIVEVTAIIVWEIAAAKFNRALDIESQGICAVKR